MFLSTVLSIVQSLADLVAGVFLLRFLMQWARVPFRNQLGQFVIAASDWAVLPLRKLLPSVAGLDTASIVLAWLTHALYFSLAMLLVRSLGVDTLGLLALATTLECARTFLYVIFGAVLLMAVMSWISPYSPLAPVLQALTRPFLAPLQRLIPPLGGIDLSALVLLIILQLLLGLLNSLGATLMF